MNQNMKIRTMLTATNAIITKLKPPAMAPELLLVLLSGFGVLPRGLVVEVKGLVVGSASTKYAYTYKAGLGSHFQVSLTK